MEILKRLNVFTKISLITGTILVMYGYICRWTGIYFFWESRSIGWALLLIGAIGLLACSIKIKKERNSNTVGEKIGIGFIAFILLIQTALHTIIPFSGAYAAATAYIRNSPAIQSETGNINGFSLLSSGSIQQGSQNGREHGYAIINMTIKGDKKYKDVTVYVFMDNEHPDWEVEDIE